jgi:hypothetical protein
MKKLMVLGIILITGSSLRAQDPITEVIKAGITKVIKAVDLRIQRLQNETIRLQNAQKVIENTLAKLHLDDISGWVDKQRTLYRDYFDELQKVKAAVKYYHRVKELIELQAAMISIYKQAIGLFKQDSHLRAAEIEYISDVYSGIFDASVKQLDAVQIVLSSFTTSMTDAQRMEAIDKATLELRRQYDELNRFTSEVKYISIQRSADANEIKKTKSFYGL